MPSVTEAATGGTPLSAALDAGVQNISYNQEVAFTRYVRQVLPLDGYVFWVKATLLSPEVLATVADLPDTITTRGSLHYAQNSLQEETENYTVNAVVFTALSEVTDLNSADPDTLYIGSFQGMRFAFSSRGGFYKQANLYHYRGNAVYPDMATQVIDDVDQLNLTDVIVSNSLPLWLSLNTYVGLYGFRTTGVTLYPSFLVPNNLVPPYGAVHIPPESTSALGGAPRLSAGMTHSQLVVDRVKITLYGQRNFNAMDFVDCVNQWSLDYDIVGIMNQPTIRDEKRTQNELNTIAQKKSVEYQINYYQDRVNTIARQLIVSAVPTYHFQ